MSGTPPLRIPLQASPQQPADRGRRRGGKRGPVGLLREHERQRVGGIVGVERAAPRQHLVEDGPERPDIGSLVHRPAARLLRAHIRRRPQDDPGGGGVHRNRGRARRSRTRGAVRFECFRETEIEDLDGPIGADLDVRWLQIAVDDSGGVRGLERLDDLPGDCEGLVERQRPCG